MTRKTQKALNHRRRLLCYHLKGALGPLARMYWLGRLDEVRKLRKALR